MHETQYARVRAASLEEALGRFEKHIQALGGIDNWWRLEGAWVREDNEVIVPPPEEDAGVDHADLLTEMRTHLATEDGWIRAAWDAVAGPRLRSWAETAADEDEDEDGEPVRRGPVFELPVEAIPRWFLGEARELLLRYYQELELDGPFRRGTAQVPGILAASWRLGLAQALEAILEALDDPRLEATLPFLPGRGPYEWPAHLLDGEGERTFYLLIDMHS